MPTHPFVSRFFVDSDVKRESLASGWPDSWWSRPYEYEWCMNFVSPHDIVLDAGCGLAQPLKFDLAEYCEQAHACDPDPRVLSLDAIVEEVERELGDDAARECFQRLPGNLKLAQAELTALPYENESLDTIFCISSLDRLPKQDLEKAFQEFYRTLNSEGLLVLTFEYPLHQPHQMNEILLQAGFDYWGETDFALPANAISSPLRGGIHCFRAVLKKVSLEV